MMGVYEDLYGKLMAGVEVKKPKGFFEKAADRVTANWNSAQGEKEEPLEQRMEREGLERTAAASAESVKNYFTGAYQGGRELINAGLAVKDVDPMEVFPGNLSSPEFSDMPMPAKTEAQKQAVKRYHTAAKNFAYETIAPATAPAAVGLSMLGMGAGSALLFSPFVLADLQDKVEEYGAAEGTLRAGAGLFTPAAVQYAAQDEAQSLADKDPYAFRSKLMGNAAFDVLGLGAVGGNKIRDSLRRITSEAMGDAEKDMLHVVNNVLNNEAAAKGNKGGTAKNKPVVKDMRPEQGMLDETQSLPEVKLAIDERNFAMSVDDVIAGRHDGKEMVRVMTTPLSLELAGADILPVEISPSNLKKIAIAKHNAESGKMGEGMTADILKQIPRALTDPLMIFEASYKGKADRSRIVAVLDLKDKNGATIVTPFELRKTNDKKGYEINEMLSSYGKTDKKTGNPAVKWFEDNIREGRLKYLNKEKAAEWLNSARDEYPMLEKALNSSSIFNVATEKDFVNLKNRKQEYYALGKENKKAAGLARERRNWKNVKPITRKELDALFDRIVPVRVGGLGEDYKGLFKTMPEVARVREYGDYYTMSHEVGHFLDKKLQIAGHDEELIAGADRRWSENEIYQGFKNEEKRAEGVAEYIRDAFADPDMAAKNYPGFHEAFIKALSKPENKGLAKDIDNLADGIRRYYNMSEEARAAAAVSRSTDKDFTPLPEKMKKFFTKEYGRYVDKANVIDNVVKDAERLKGKTLPFEDNPYKLVRSVDGYVQGRAGLLINDKGDAKSIISVLNSEVYNGALKHEVTWQDILKDLDAIKIPKENLRENGYENVQQAFDVFLIARHQLELQESNPKYKGPISKETAQIIIENAPAGFKEAADKVYKFIDNSLSILEESGMISKEYHKELNNKYKYYVPMDRDIPGSRESGAIAKTNAKVANIDAPTKRISSTGAAWNVWSPMETIPKKMLERINSAERNKVGQALAKLGDIEGIGRLVEERKDLNAVVDNRLAIKSLLNERKRALNERSNILNERKEVLNEWRNILNERQKVLGKQRNILNERRKELNRQRKYLNERRRSSNEQLKQIRDSIKAMIKQGRKLRAEQGKKDNVISVWIDGANKYFETTPELYNAATEYSRPNFGMFLTAMSGAADIMRAGATGTPAFGIANAVRDALAAPLFSKNNFIPILDSLRGLYWRAADKKARIEFKAAGVPMGTRIKTNGAQVKWEKLKTINILGKEYNNIFYNVLDKTLGKAFEKIKGFNQAMEEAARMGEFVKARRKGKSVGEAGFDAKDLMDFGRSGTVTKEANRIIPFLNVTVQAADKTIRAAKENPKHFLSMVAAYTVVPAIVEWVSFHDEEWYSDMPREFKDNYVFLRNPLLDDGMIYRLPVPQELAAFNGGVKRGLSALMNKDKEAMKGWATHTLNNLTPDLIPAIARPFIEWASGYNWFMDRMVIPQKLERLPDELQYDIYTSILAVRIGELTGTSPMKIDNLIQNVGASAAKDIVGLGDYVLGRENALPEKKFREAPIVGRFNYTKWKHSQNVDDFYNLYNETEKQWYGYGRKGKNVKNWDNLKNAMKKVRTLNQKRRAILNNPKLNAQEKRTQMDKIQRDIIRIATMANEKYRE